MPFRCLSAALVLIFLVSCASPPAYQEQGLASHIANAYAGRYTTSGVPYNPMAYTAAHTSLPFGTEAVVKNLYNGREVKVVVNDRFPFYPGRVINLSSAAAQYIGIPYNQLAQVQVTAQKVAQPMMGGYGQPQAQPPPQPMAGGYGGAPAGYGYQPQYQPAYQPQQQPQPYTAPAPTGYGPPPAGYGTAPAPAPGYGGYSAAPAYPPAQAPAGGYAPAPAYTQPTYKPPQNYIAPAYTAPKPAAAPKPTYQVQQPAGRGAPNAPSYQGGGGPPPGLRTF